MVAARAANIPSRKYPELKGVLRNERVVLPALDVEKLRAEDARNTKGGERKIRLGVNLEAGYTPATHGKWIELSDAAVPADQPQPKAYAFGITARNAEGMRLHFTNFTLPAGAKMYVYAAENDKHNFVYEGRGPQGTGEFWTPIIFGTDANIEVSAVKAELTSFEISQVAQMYRDPFKSYDWWDPAGTCNLDVSCYASWDARSKSVGIMVTQDSEFIWACSGVMLNNAANDGAQFFATANHCIANQSEASQAAFYFGFRSASCNGGRPSGADIIPASSATFLGTSGFNNADSTLVLIEGGLPNGVTWSGWTLTDPAIGSSITGIHHPRADYQRISFGNIQSPDSFTTFHRVRWSSGITEPGSSGSPLFNAAGEVMGLLSRGGSACGTPFASDYYGQLSVAYPFFVDQSGNNYLQVGLPDDAYEQNDTRETAATLNSNFAANSLVSKPGDEDWFKIHLLPNHLFNAFFLETPYTASMVVELYQANNATPTQTFSFNSGLIATGLLEQDVYLRIRANDGHRHFYNLNLSDREANAPLLVADYLVSTLNSIRVSGGPSEIQYIPVDFWVEYGTGNDPSTFQKSPVTHWDPANPGSGNAFSYTISGLQPGVQYSIRTVADNGFKRGYGNIIHIKMPGADHLNVSPVGSVDLGQVAIGVPITRSITIVNPGPAAVHLFSISGGLISNLLENPQLTHNCPADLQVQQLCTATITFRLAQPTTTSNLVASIVVNSDAYVSQAFTFYKAQGSGPLLTTGKWPNYPHLLVNSRTVDALAIMNKGNAPMSLLSFQVMSGNFLTIEPNNCPPSLPPGTGCLINLVLNPKTTGSFFSDVRLYFSETAYQSFSVSGDAFDITLAMNRPHRPGRGATAQTASASQAMRASVIVSAPGYSGPVALSCTNVPANLTCNLAQNSVNVSADGSPTWVDIQIGVRGAGRLARDVTNARASRLSAEPAAQRIRSATVTVNASAGGAVRSLQIPVQYVQ